MQRLYNMSNSMQNTQDDNFLMNELIRCFKELGECAPNYKPLLDDEINQLQDLISQKILPANTLEGKQIIAGSLYCLSTIAPGLMDESHAEKTRQVMEAFSRRINMSEGLDPTPANKPHLS